MIYLYCNHDLIEIPVICFNYNAIKLTQIFSINNSYTVAVYIHLHRNGVMTSLVKQSTKWDLILCWRNLRLSAFKSNTKATAKAMANSQQSLPPVCF